MRARHLPFPLLVVAAACSGGAEPARVALEPSLVFPQGVLDGVTKLSISVYDAAPGLDCDPKTGKITGTGKPFNQTDLGTTLNGGPCPSGGKFCGQLSIPKADTDRIFQAQASAAASADVADGCTKAVVNQDALPLKIVMIRFVPPAVCGNGTIEATEQCEPPDPTCDPSCHTTEQGLSTSGGAGSKKNLFFLWPTGSGDGGRLLAFFSDTSPNALPTSTGEVSMRVMSDAFAPLAAFPSTTYLPNDPNQFPPAPQPGKKQLPSAAVVGTSTFVVFDDDSAGTPDIHLRSMDSSFTAKQPFNAPIGINGTSPDGGGETGIQTAPAIAAGPGGALFIAWEDDSAQKIAGRTYTNGTLGPQQDISSGTGNRNVQLAVTSNGWICVWEGAGDIKMRSIDASGKPFGSETIVNENTQGQQDRPAIASLSDGRFAVVWSDHASTNGADIVLQRYTAAAAKVPGDQSAPANTTVAGDQVTPQIASMNASGGSFVAVWVDSQTSHVRGRLMGGSSGALFNNVDGQAGDFQASATDGRQRANPTVAVGGSSPFIAIGWEDQGSTTPFGVVGRRFPLPK